MFVEFNPNPNGRRVSDCAVRAIAAAFNVTWDEAYDALSHNAKLMGDLPNSDSVWGALLRQMGFTRETLPDSCPDCYTVEDFAHDHPYGVYVLKTSEHVVTVVDGDWYDTFDSGREIVSYVWRRDRQTRRSQK